MSKRLSLINRTKHTSPPRIGIHGESGVGKSTLFAGGTVSLPTGDIILPSAPNPIFIPTEDGLRGLDTSAFPVADTYQDVVDNLTALASEDHDYKTVVIDSADWLEMLIHQQVINTCTHDVNGTKTMSNSHGGYGRGYEVAMLYWRNILKALDYLNTSKKMVVGIICHSSLVSINDPNSEQPFDRFEMKLHQPKRGTGARDLLVEWSDILGFANSPISVSEKKTTDGKKIVRGSKSRGTLNKLHLRGSAAFTAGNRYNLPEKIDLSWEVLASELVKHSTDNAPTHTEEA